MYEQPATLTLEQKAEAGILEGDEARWLQLVEQHRTRQLIDAQTAAEDIRLQAREAARRRAQERAAAERGSVSSRILTVTQMRALKQPAPLVPNVAYTGAVGVILGDSQTGKTWVMLSIAAAAATARSWPTGGKQRDDLAAVPVLYVAAEDGGSIAKRMAHWEAAHGDDLSRDGVTFHVHPSSINLLDEVQVDEVCDAVTTYGYRFVIFDTVAASLGGEEEGNPQFSKVVQHMRKVVAATRGTGSVFLVHHFGKDKSKGARGGSSLFADSDIVWELHGTLDAMQMRNTKWKIDAQRHPWRLRLDQSGEYVYLRADTSPASVSAPDVEDKYAALARRIIEICEQRCAENRGYGPSRNVIVGALRERGVKFNDSDVRPALDLLVADRRLLMHEGPKRAVWYRLRHAQEAISGFDDAEA